MSQNSLVTLWTLLSLVRIATGVDITYHVDEEKSEGSFLGDIASDSHLLHSVPLKDHHLITFSQLQHSTTTSSGLFNVSKTGKLFTAKKLDTESLCTYNTECFRIVKVAVKRAETFMKILKIKVIIEDINDHKPQFQQKEITIEFSEDDSKGARRSLPNAVDKDVGLLNSQITYELKKNKDEPFSLTVSKNLDGTSELSIVLGERLNREVKDIYSIQVIAKDGGYPTKQSILEVKVSVKDVNDNAPIFSQNIYNVSIKNQLYQDSPIVVLSAKDMDSGENANITFHFTLKTPDVAKEHFKLNKQTGEIFLDKTFALGQTLVYKLFVRATDGGRPPLSSIAMVVVYVVNQQNNAPAIDVNFVSALNGNRVAISEDIKTGSFIAYVMVTDNDIGKNGEVSCDLKHEAFQLLSLGSKEYKVIVKRAVDREKEDNYDITISCEDKGSPPLKTESKFSIQVQDVNDLKPLFSKQTFKFLTYENQKPNFPIGFINATDQDTGVGGELIYSLLETNKNYLPFKITKNGFISTTRTLDCEQQELYKFKVLVKDNGTPSLNNTANVIVEVMDENDNAPYFVFPNINPFRLDIFYHPQSKNNITVLKASDRDSRMNAFLRYEIVGGDEKLMFKVNPYTGHLYFSRPIYPTDAGTYKLKVAVKDNGTPTLSATTTLSLKVILSNNTSEMLTATYKQTDGMINLNLAIVIVVVAVMLSVALVIFITACVVRYNNLKNNTSKGSKINNMNKFCRDKRNLISETSNSIVTLRSPDDIRSSQMFRSRSHLYPDVESQTDWDTSSSRTLPPATQMCIQRIATTDSILEDNSLMIPSIRRETLSSHADFGHGWSEGDSGEYEEIPDSCTPLVNKARSNLQPITVIKPL
ncbi:protocadherin beta-16 [Argonauta hians]